MPGSILATDRSQSIGFFYVILASITWGINGVIVNYVNLSPFSIAFFRVFFAALFLFPLLYLKRRSGILKATKIWKSILTLGVLLSLGWGFLFEAMKFLAIADAVLLNYTAPVFVALLGPFFLKEPTEKSTVFAIALSLIGITVISYQYGFQLHATNLLGIIFGLLASLSYALFIILSKRTLTKISSSSLAFWMYLTSAILLLPSIMGSNLNLPFTSWTLLLLLGGFSTGFAVTLYLEGLKFIKTQKAVVLTYLEPLSSIVFGALFLSQEPTIFMLGGGSLILIASYIAVSK